MSSADVEVLRVELSGAPPLTPLAQSIDHRAQLLGRPASARYSRPRPLASGWLSTTPASSSSRRRWASSVREISGMPCRISLNRCEPASSSRRMSGVQRSAKISHGDGDGTELAVALHAPDSRHERRRRGKSIFWSWQRAGHAAIVALAGGARAVDDMRSRPLLTGADRLGSVSPASWRPASPPAPPLTTPTTRSWPTTTPSSASAALFSAGVPAELGGGGASHAEMCDVLARARARLRLDRAGAVDAHAPGDDPGLALAPRAGAGRAAAAPRSPPRS